MNLRLVLISLAALAAAPAAWPRIIVDDSAPEPAAEPSHPAINVPQPGDNPGEQAAAPTQDTLSFLNKDQLHGTLLNIGKDGLRWQSPESSAPILFKTTNLAGVKLGSQHALGTAHPAAQIVGLTNNDELPGNVVSVDGKELTLDTWYAGRLTIPRAMLRRISPLGAGSSALYEGPTGMEGWVAGNMGGGRSWSFRNGALVGTNFGSIGRDVKLPDMSSIEFDAVLRGNGQLSISLYSDRPNEYGNCYMLQLNTNFAELQRYSRNGGSNDLGNVQFQNAMRRDKIHVELRTDKTKKNIWLLIDGKMVKEWSDPAEFNGHGGCLMFSCQPGSFIKISNIKVAPWDGKFEDSAGSANKTTEDTVKLANQDKVSGHLAGIQDGKVKFASSYAELNIPLERIQEMDFASANASVAKADPGDVRVSLPGDGIVTMKLLKWDEKSCTGSSPNFGQAGFVPNAFARILFNLPNQPHGDNSDESSDDSGSGDTPEP